MRRLRLLFALPVIAAMLPAVPARAQTAPLFSVYPSYSAKFDLGSEKFSLVTSVVVYNISGQTFTNVTFKQTYPEGVSVKQTYQRELGTAATGEQEAARKVEGNMFFARTDAFRNRQYVVIFNELELARRLNEITFPGIEISYTDPEGTPQTSTLQSGTYDLFVYSNVVGGLARFLNKYNRITFDFAKAVPDRSEWEFAPIAAGATGRLPTGIIGTSPGENQYNGHFRIRSGAPGDNIQLLVIYKQTNRKQIIADQETLLARVGEYLRWCGEFDIVTDGLKVEPGKWGKYKDAWSIDGRWVDTIKNRLGEGPLMARVFYGPREDVEYFVIGLAHGRGLGPEGSATPNPEKEAQLLGEIERLFGSFKSSIVPLSYERR